MMHLIDELKVIPGVIGACIFSSQEGLKATNLPVIFKPERLNVVGKHLTKLYAAGRMSFDDLTDITLNYDESVVVARELERNTLIFAICDPSFNHNLLSMSFNLLQEEFKGDAFSSATAAETEASSVQAPAVKKLSQQPAAKVQQEISADLKGLLAEMKGALAKILGPMAEFVFDEVTEEWIEAGADFSRIDNLVEKINGEIGDARKAEEYRQLIAPALKNY
ncbi:MAG: hypothetical protein OQK50_07600 [Deltaproteobacteria bacterium]|jgi:hypothetical protein|nr:hypothetical protein [Deltaproteobacteria bacterium]MCW8892055.1 hypothetical protein [Deltaproteobacteria bacterium]MCW9050177.1 hypothetical protein [Deltaproteobacteria bacterium]